MRKTSGYLLMTAVTLATACSQSTDDHGLAAARARWATQGLTAYHFTSTRSCECPPEMTRPINVEVVSGQVVRGLYADDQQPVSDQVRAALWTVDHVFDQIQTAIDQSAAQLDLRFDPTLGYPTSVFVDYSRQIADEELALQLAGLTPTGF